MQITSVMSISVITNIFLVCLKISCGILGCSSALIADGIHSLSDLITDFFAMIGAKLSSKPPDEKHPFGHRNIEYITSLFIGLIILGVGIEIIKKAFYSRIIISSSFVLFISLITIFCKYLLARYILKQGRIHNNQILLASGNESKTDVISSIVVFISASLMQLSNEIPLFQYADKLAAIIVGLFILRIAFSILKDNLSYIIGEQETDPYYRKQIETIILRHKQITKIENLILLKYGAYYKVTSTIKMNGSISLAKAHKIIDHLEAELKTFEPHIGYLTIHMEPSEE